MRTITSLLLIVLTAITFSCNQSKSKDAAKENETTQEVAANYKSIEVDIEGMTCEIGCARLIQSKMSKVDGVAYTKVSFESKKGLFTYDSNKLSAEDISEKIGGIAGGDLYSVSKTTAIDLIEDDSIENNEAK
ncbi:cation transporter [Lutibacter sp. A64]|uniref:heavy-metal-associated domain-containing protein n=1 Tax=Lutibacter sp. A64 TaxID=2918526 RepID=UPI001F068C59|nr:heavy-metal-associated domain-containing protein [Lutibacter sp. A64]UMB52828.1 cation transporter [Lutibacter sp. A64]